MNSTRRTLSLPAIPAFLAVVDPSKQGVTVTEGSDFTEAFTNTPLVDLDLDEAIEGEEVPEGWVVIEY